ncbi:MAG: hypothetical protein IH934_03715 [Nanoarchaeota archaeon]|nr:hypothetical protein [Nanoarchaeota archaeon]
MDAGIDLEALVDEYQGDAIKGAGIGVVDISRNDIYRFPAEWTRSVVTGIYPNFYNGDVYPRKQEAIGIGEFLSDAKNAGLEDEYIRPINSVHVAKIRKSYTSLESLIDPIVKRFNADQEILEEVLDNQYIRILVATIPTAYQNMRVILAENTGIFIGQFGQQLKEKGLVDIIEQEQLLKKAWTKLRGNAKPALFEYEEPEVEQVYTHPQESKLPLYTEEELKEHNEKIKPFVNELIKMAKSRITTENPLEVSLVWDREAYESVIEKLVNERVIGHLATKSDVSTQDIAKLSLAQLAEFLVLDRETYESTMMGLVTRFSVLPGKIDDLNPVKLTALIVYTLQERREQGEISKTEYLKLLGEVLDHYKFIHTISKIYYDQSEGPLSFFKDIFPTMIENNGYSPMENVFQDLARETSLDENITLDSKDEAKIIINLALKDVGSSDEKGPLNLFSFFKTWEGSKQFLYYGGDDSGEQIKEVVWRTIPRLIEAKGYISVETAINSNVRPYKREVIIAAKDREKGNLRYTEVFENTTQGDLVYVVPGNEKQFVDHLHELANEHYQQFRLQRRKQYREQRDLTSAVEYQTQPIVTATRLSNVIKDEVPEKLEETVSEELIDGTLSENKRSEFYGIQKTYHSTLHVPSKKRTPNRVRNSFHNSTNRYASFLERNPESIEEFEPEVRRDISYGEEFIRKLPKQPKDFINGFESQLDKIRVYLPDEVQQQKDNSTGVIGFFSKLMGR